MVAAEQAELRCLTYLKQLVLQAQQVLSARKYRLLDEAKEDFAVAVVPFGEEYKPQLSLLYLHLAAPLE